MRDSSFQTSEPGTAWRDRGTWSVPSASTGIHDEILLVEQEATSAIHGEILRTTCRVARTVTSDVAVGYLRKSVPALVVIDADTVAGDGTAICRAAKEAVVPATILVTASDASAVPRFLHDGCDSVLLKPFAPNLFYARIGRLLRMRDERLESSRPAPQTGSSATTNRTWDDETCPQCSRDGAVSFEFSSHRRAWYACVGCSAVWLGKRRD